MMDIKQPAVAGQFYASDATSLARDVTTLLAEVPAIPNQAFPKAIIAPHAGYVYSGLTAAYAYAVLEQRRQQIKKVILLGPAHRYPVNNIAVHCATFFATPLGKIKIDTTAKQRILELASVEEIDEAFQQEHSLEVHLPFLQTQLDNFELLPVLIGNADHVQVAEVLEMLWGGDETLIVISTDLSHFHDYQTANAMDKETVAAIIDKRFEKLDFESACGRGAVAGLLNLARRRHYDIVNLDYRNSGDTAGDKNRVVGYAAFHLYENKGAN